MRYVSGLISFPHLLFMHQCIHLYSTTGACMYRNLSCSRTMDYLNHLRQEASLSRQKCQPLTTKHNLSSLSVMEQLIWKSSRALLGCVCVCVSPLRLSYCGDGFCSVRTGMAAFLGHAARHLQFPAVILWLQFESKGTYSLTY